MLDNQVQAWLASQSKTGINPIDYTLVDNGDGNGPQIGRWNEDTLGPQPTTDQLSAVSTQAEALATAALLKQGEVTITAWLDQTAQANGYDNIVSACSYQLSNNDLWKRQGAAYVTWRDAVWAAAETLQAQVLAGTAQPPSNIQDLLASLPQPNIPTS